MILCTSPTNRKDLEDDQNLLRHGNTEVYSEDEVREKGKQDLKLI